MAKIAEVIPVIAPKIVSEIIAMIIPKIVEIMAESAKIIAVPEIAVIIAEIAEKS